jgi:hypothetical protein
MSSDITLNRDSFILEVNDKAIVPTFVNGERFIDLGESFAPMDIKPATDNDYLVIFELENSDVKSSYNFKIKNIRNSIANIDSAYREILIKPTDLDKVKDMGTKSIGDKVLLNNRIFKSSSLLIQDYDIKERFTEDWNYCTNSGVCRKNGVYTIMPSTANEASINVLKLTATFEHNEELNAVLKKRINYASDLIGYYGHINYTLYGNNKTVKLTKISDSDFSPDSFSYYEVPSEIKNASKIDLILIIRDTKYTFNLK